MTDESLNRAAALYAEGISLAVLACEFGVHARTLAREFTRAGVVIRQRNGWPARDIAWLSSRSAWHGANMMADTPTTHKVLTSTDVFWQNTSSWRRW